MSSEKNIILAGLLNNLNDSIKRLSTVDYTTINSAVTIDQWLSIKIILNTIISIIDNVTNILAKKNPDYNNQINNMVDNIDYSIVRTSDNRKIYDPNKLPYQFILKKNKTMTFLELKKIFSSTYQILSDDLINYKIGIFSKPKISDETPVLILSESSEFSHESIQKLCDFFRKILDKLITDANITQKGGTTKDLNIASSLLTFITYKIGLLNSFDQKLINYCQGLGFDDNLIITILIAQNKNDIEQIIHHYLHNDGYPILINILKLKKFSAELKFRKDYGINSDNDLNTLISKQNIW
jgi:hypothetical protein